MRLITNLILTGIIAEVDKVNWRCRVRTGDLTIHWINWLRLRAGKTRTWWCPSVGEQVLLLAIGGNLDTAQYVDNKINQHEQSRRHPDASLTEKGLIQLCSDTNNASETLAATPLAVKTVNDNASGRLKKPEIVLMDNYRITAGNRAFFLRFDGSNFYILKTAAGEADGGWENTFPFRINASTGRVFLAADTRVEGRIYAQDAELQPDGNVYGSVWGCMVASGTVF